MGSTKEQKRGISCINNQCTRFDKGAVQNCGSASFMLCPDYIPKNGMHGHPMFYEILDKLAVLHSKKNHDYASGGDPLGNFKRVAKILGMYPDLQLSDPTVVAMVYMMKQLDAALWLLSNGHKAQVEGIADRLQDVAVYSIIETVLQALAAGGEDGGQVPPTN